MNNSILRLSDGYKLVHWQQYAPKTEYIYSYFESRIGSEFNELTFVGLQYFLKRYLVGVRVTQEEIDKTEVFCEKYFGRKGLFNREGWEYILNVHKGKLPVRIKAVPEGTVVSVSNVLMTVENTDPKCFWLTNYLETLLTNIWHCSTTSTLSREVKKILKKYRDKNSDDIFGIDYQLHCFGMRGCSSPESSALGSFGHVLNFKGTDTINAIELAEEYYHSDVCANSVVATEHSQMTQLGREKESEVFARLIDQYPDGILSVVSDSYDIYNACRQIIGIELKEKIMKRNGIFVVRPDSGNPEEVTVSVLNILRDKFGCTKNTKGYNILPNYIRVLWGDGIDMRGIEGILGAMEVWGWAAENIVFGMGGGLLQKTNRDSARFAFKCSATCIDGVWQDVQKNPMDKTKTSKKGKLALIKDSDNQYKTVSAPHEQDLLKTVFENGELLIDYTLEEVRKNAAL